MIKGKKIVGVVPARGGSKRLAGKNLLPLGGRPMIGWTIDAGLNAKALDRLIVSTDDPAIAEIARQCGADVPFLRPAGLARDESTSEDALMHALDNAGEAFDIAVLLQPTSPLRQSEDIDSALETFIGSSGSAGVSVYAPAKPLAWSMTVDTSGHLTRIFGPGCAAGAAPLTVYVPNGAMFIVDVASFRHQKTFYPADTVPLVMPASRSIDVDTADDLMLAEHLLRRTTGGDDVS